jgi:hypothetical protein
MPKLTRMDEYFVHQIPEPLPNPVIRHPHWRESYFFAAHGKEATSDVLIVAMAHYPAREMMDAILMGRVGGQPIFGHHQRPYEGDPHTTVVGPVSVEIVEPYQKVKVDVEEHGGLAMELVFTARTPAYGLRRGRMEDHDGIVWDQSHMIQSGTYEGRYKANGVEGVLEDWWGQRDHSWGIRDHGRCPMWMWLAIQLPEGMLGVWHWELANGARIYTDGCFAPAGGEEDIIEVVDFHHALSWIGADRQPVGYGMDGMAVEGLAGRVEITLEDGRTLGVEAEGSWCAPYRAFVGGGQHLMAVRTDDGQEGVAVYELTGVHHHRYFPEKLSTPLRRD